MSQIMFYRALLWLPLLVPIVLAPLWLVPGAADSSVSGPPLFIVTYGALYAAVPYAAFALWVDNWIRAVPHPEPTAIWRRALMLPIQFAPVFALWQAVSTLVISRVSGGSIEGEIIIAAGLSGALWVVVIGYVYVGLACGLTRLAMWVGCVRAPTQAPAT